MKYLFQLIVTTLFIFFVHHSFAQLNQPVTIKDDGATYTLANGYVSLKID